MKKRDFKNEVCTVVAIARKGHLIKTRCAISINS